MGDVTPLRGRHALGVVAVCCLLLQTVSATVQTRSFDTPNASTWLARSLAERGDFAVGELRAYHLPGEALYLAAGFVMAPEPLWRYLHVPVVVLFALAITAVALAAGGPAVGLAAGLAASADPFVLRHGPVWDDAFLAAALVWSIFAVLVSWRVRPLQPTAAKGALLAAVVGTAAWAAVTRTEAQVILGLAALGAIGLPRFRPIRPVGWAVLLGLVVGLGAWGARNAVVLGSFHIGSTHDGKTLYEANCPSTRAGILETGVVGGFLRRCSEPQVDAALALGELEADRQLRRYALEYMASHPLDVVRTAGLKLFVSLTGIHFGAPLLSWRNAGGVSSSVMIALLGTYGLGRWRQRTRPTPAAQRVWWLCVATVVVTLAVLALGPVGLRYRITLAGFLYLGIGAAAAPGGPRQ